MSQRAPFRCHCGAPYCLMTSLLTSSSLLYFISIFFFWSFSISLARWKSAPASWKHCMLLHTHLLKKKEERLPRFFVFCVFKFLFHVCESGQEKLSFSLQCSAAWRWRASWTKTVFHCGLTGSCESIYSLTAMRQNGPWERREARSEEPEETRQGLLPYCCCNLTMRTSPHTISACLS